ncbi:MAG: hypothetical protein AAF487_06870 [Bacteroidota bacterium]
MKSLLGHHQFEEEGVNCNFKGNVAEFLIQDNSLSVQLFKQIEKRIFELSGQSKYYSIINTLDYTKLNADLREYLISEDRSWIILAEAVRVRNLAKKLMSDIYFQLNLPLVPTKTFLSTKDARTWIEALNPSPKAANI